jgi:hypothetical protein
MDLNASFPVKTICLSRSRQIADKIRFGIATGLKSHLWEVIKPPDSRNESGGFRSLAKPGTEGQRGWGVRLAYAPDEWHGPGCVPEPPFATTGAVFTWFDPRQSSLTDFRYVMAYARECGFYNGVADT